MRTLNYAELGDRQHTVGGDAMRQYARYANFIKEHLAREKYNDYVVM